MADTVAAEDLTAAVSPRRRRRRRGPRIVAAVFTVATGGAVTVAALGLGGGSPSGDGADGGLPPKTAGVTRQTLQDIQTADGELGYGTTTDVASRLAGTLTRVPASGTKVTRGQALYEVDDRPVLLLYGKLPAYRALGRGDEGDDVRQLERNLAALGYTGFTVDEEFTYLTEQAVKAWQEDLGLPETGALELGRVQYAPRAVRVDSTEAKTGDTTGPGQKVLAYTGTDKSVTAELNTADQRLARKGATVRVLFPDGTAVKGVVAGVTTVLHPADQQTEAETKVEVVVRFADAAGRKAARGFDQAGVHVEFTAGERENVLTVPVAALLALAEGGFGVEVVEGTESRYVPVTTGLFANGRVEVSGDGIAEGTKVGMPK
ncbi:peptidoglycan-binding domain-containing protein [Streptomyces sp. NPDC051940]|uniref:efflux RND transporter periplasmic adaptor subunit n=1 Tax=Streptomyces sp. NPDC051940 TaxID=3155675 RepID=UPI00343D3CE0